VGGEFGKKAFSLDPYHAFSRFLPHPHPNPPLEREGAPHYFLQPSINSD
jgi:hypothetical protein